MSQSGIISLITAFLISFLLFIIIVSLVGGAYFFNVKQLLISSQTKTVPTPEPVSQVSETTTCGEIPQDKLDIKQSEFINVNELTWSPGCDNVGWSISWKIAASDDRSKDLQPVGIYYYSLPDKKTVPIPFPENHPDAYFSGWANDQQMIILYPVKRNKGAVFYNIVTGHYDLPQ